MSLLKLLKIHERSILLLKNDHSSFVWLATRKFTILQLTKQEHQEFQWKLHHQQKMAFQLQFNHRLSKIFLFIFEDQED